MLASTLKGKQPDRLHRLVAVAATVGLLLTVLATAGGCTTVRRARAAQRDDGRQAGERIATAAQLRLGPATTLTLDDVIRLALTNSPSVQQAQARLAAAEAQRVQALAGYLPQLGASADATLSGKDYGAGLSLSDDLFSFGRTAAAVRQARAQCASARAALQAAQNDTIYAARVAYYGLYRAQELLGVDEASVHDYQSHLEQVRVMASLGTRIRYDVTKAEVDLGNARLAALTAHNDVLTARAALSRALGLSEPLPGAIAIPDAATAEIGDREILYRTAHATNPALLALRATADAASAAVDAAIANLYPDLSLSAGYSFGGSRFPLARAWSLGPALDWNAFTGWRNSSAVDASVAALRVARAAVADREQQLQQDLTNAFAGLDTARDKAALAELLVRQSRENLDLTAERYRLGLATSVELTDAEVAVTQTRSQQVEAQYAEWVARAQIRLNTGE